MKETCDVMEKIIPLFAVPARFPEIENLLTGNSNLPGPRGNLTLAFRWADYFERTTLPEGLGDLLDNWANISAAEAPTNNPREYLTFCAVLAWGAHYCYAAAALKKQIMDRIRAAMNDARWRIKEAAAMGLQRIAEKDFQPLQQYITGWYDSANFLEKRAFIAALAHPPILQNPEVAAFSLKISEAILNEIRVCGKAARRSEDFTVLSKGLQYALSVFVAHQPDDGFALLKKFAGWNDPDLQKIMKANLNKSRLTKKYQRQVDEVSDLLNP